MLNAAVWGGIAGSAVFLGAVIGILFNIRKKVIGYIMAFGTGILIGAASFELLQESLELGGIKVSSIGFILGALLFTVIDILISKSGGSQRKRSKKRDKHSGLAIFIGTIIDAIPESVIIGISLLEENSVSILLVIAIFISNFPEGLSSSVGLKKNGYSSFKILLLWSLVLILSILSSLCGFTLFKSASKAVIAMIGAFAAGGVVSMVSSTMMPEAYEEGGPVVGFIAALGLFISLVLTNLQ